MDLISGQPLWPVAAGLPASYPALRSDLECEVVVLGAGITGALVTHRFAADGIDVVVLDRRTEVAKLRERRRGLELGTRDGAVLRGRANPDLALFRLDRPAR